MEIKINNLERNTSGDVVTIVHYTVNKTDGEFTASTYGTVSLEVGDVVIPYADLTEETVVGWVSEKLDLVTIEASLDAQLNEQKTPTKASGVPWN